MPKQKENTKPAYGHLDLTIVKLIDGGVQEVTEIARRVREICSPGRLGLIINRLRDNGLVVGDDKLSLTRRGQAMVPSPEFRDKSAWKPAKVWRRENSCHAHIPSVMGGQRVKWRNPI